MEPIRMRNLRLLVEVDDHWGHGLKKLKIVGKQLDPLNPELFNINELQVLELSPERESCLYFKISRLPSEIGQLTNLKVLILDTNDLTAIPNEIGHLQQLERLSISNNRLKDLPSEFGKLRRLKSLHAANNRLETFTPELCQLKRLVFLDMCDNYLTGLDEGIGQLENLESLLLHHNAISDLPSGICELQNLRTLWLGSNRLRRLPRRFGNLRQLDWGKGHTPSTAIDDNPLAQPPLDICRRGVLAIDKFFERTMLSGKLKSRPSVGALESIEDEDKQYQNNNVY